MHALFRPRLRWALALAALLAPAVADAAPARPLPGGATWEGAGARETVEALTPDVIRVRWAPRGAQSEDASWAVGPGVRRARAAVTPAADGFTTASLRVRIDPATGAVRVETPDGRLITQDAAEPLRLQAGRGFQLRRALATGEHIYALGDKTGELDRRGGNFVDWNTDSFGFKSSTDPIYKSIPFYIAAGGAGGAYGVFTDNTWRLAFDFGKREPDVIAVDAPDGPADTYVIAGPQVRDVVRRYTALTGRAPLPPRWALGYQQSRYSYGTAQEVRDVIGRLRAERVPTDVVWLDIDFQDRNRPFTVDTEAFPDFAGLIRELGGEGVKLITIADLHVARAPGEGYAPYDTGAAGDQFVHAADGSTYVGVVWPGPSVFPDFTRAATREWFGGLYKPFLDMGVAGVWSDMNEPAIFKTPTLTMPLDNRHRIASDDFAPRVASHAEIHNVFGMENTRAAYDGLLRLKPDARPFVMTRASYAGGQRYAVTWTGDNLATWDHLRLAVHQIENLGLSGFTWSTADAGGFAGGASPELLTRWFEIGAFLPLFRDHTAKGAPRAEPWVDGPEQLAIRKRFVEARYRLLPYLYATADGAARTGDPSLRPVFYDYPDAASGPCDTSMSFTVGRSLWVAAPPKPESPQAYDVCLPAGGWWDYWTGRRVQAAAPAASGPVLSASQAAGAGGPAATVISETPRLDHLPVFVRAGSIIPRQALVQTTAQTPSGPLELHVYPGPDCRGDLYDDDGATLGYARGRFFRQALTCAEGADGALTVSFARAEGAAAPWWRELLVVVHGWRGGARATLDGRSAPARADAAADEARVVVPASPAPHTLLLRPAA